jgi:hypothetical protein
LEGEEKRVKSRLLIFCVICGLGAAPAAFADAVDYMLNLNGTTYCPSGTGATCSNDGGLAAVPGATSTLDTSYGGTGLGTVSLTYNPGVGTYDVGFWIYENVSVPGFNEYGATSGTPAIGETWQIDVPDYDYGGELGTPGAGSIIANTTASTLSNTNYVPGTMDNYLLECSGSANCNDFTSMALAYNFALAAGQEAVLNFTVSNTAPTSGFYLEQIHPVDGSNSAATSIFYDATLSVQPVGPPVPEPAFWVPLTLIGGALVVALRRRRTTAQN